ncbi:MAG: hypothetical protein ACOCTJ_01215 [Desulfobia sp.]
MKRKRMLQILTACGVSFLILTGQGCGTMSSSDSSEDMEPVSLSESNATSTPYHPKDFTEIKLPNIMELDRDKSMYVKSQDFNGGILHFSGRAEPNSLINFFENTMPGEGWSLAGSVKTRKTLLVYTKDDKTCMITIEDPNFSFSTQVILYIADKRN